MFMQNQHMYNNQWPREQNREKMEDYWCETCDKGFQTARLLENHKLQHQKCNIDGCQFIAHPRIITKHIQMQHSTGLYKKIAKLANPEEVKKWIEERKRKYPTKQNIEKKSAEIKEKIERGERLGLAKNRNNTRINKHTHDSNFKRLKQPSKIRSHSFTKDHKSVNVKKTAKPDLVTEDKRKLKPFAGIQNIIMEVDSDNDTDDTIGTNNSFDDNDNLERAIIHDKKLSKQDEPVVCNALSSLIDNYDSLHEEPNEEVKNECVIKSEVHKKPLNILNKTEKNNLDNNFKNAHVSVNTLSDSDSGPEEIKVGKPITEVNSNQKVAVKMNVHNKSQRRFDNKKPPARKFKPKMPSTLLEKLLFPEMQKERNMVLQCVCYIVKNNYFTK